MTDPGDNDPTTPPDGPGQTPPPPPPPPTDAPTLPTNEPISEAEPTTVMPAAGAAATGIVAGSGMPPVPPGGQPPPGAPLDPESEDVPWYKRPGPLAAMIIGGLLLLALIIWLIFGGSDDDKSDPGANLLIIETVDESGAAIDRGFIADVIGPADQPNAYTWLLPTGSSAPDSAGGTTGSSGRLEFSWMPTDDVSDPAAWASTIRLVEQIPPDWTPPGPIVDCVLERADEQDSTVSLSVEASTPDATADRFATYAFPNHKFIPGDLVTCSLVSTESPATTTTSTTTSTTSTTSTTVPETTTTVPATTEAPTTTADATTTTVLSTTLWEAMQADSNLSEFVALANQVGLGADFNDSSKTMTVFAPENNAIDVPPGTPDAEVLAILEPLIVDGESLAVADVASWPNPVTARGGVEYVVDAAVPSIGGAGFVTADTPGANGMLQVMDAVLVAN